MNSFFLEQSSANAAKLTWNLASYKNISDIIIISLPSPMIPLWSGYLSSHPPPHALSRRLAFRPCVGNLSNGVIPLCALHHDGRPSPVQFVKNENTEKVLEDVPRYRASGLNQK